MNEKKKEIEQGWQHRLIEAKSNKETLRKKI